MSGIICEPREDCADPNPNRWYCHRGHDGAARNVCPLKLCTQRGANLTPVVSGDTPKTGDVLPSLLRQLQFDREQSAYWQERWTDGRDGEIEAWLLSLIDFGWTPANVVAGGASTTRETENG